MYHSKLLIQNLSTRISQSIPSLKHCYIYSIPHIATIQNILRNSPFCQNIADIPTVGSCLYSSHCNNSEHFAKLTFLARISRPIPNWKLCLVFFTLHILVHFAKLTFLLEYRGPSLLLEAFGIPHIATIQNILRNSPVRWNIADIPTVGSFSILHTQSRSYFEV